MMSAIYKCNAVDRTGMVDAEDLGLWDQLDYDHCSERLTRLVDVLRMKCDVSPS